MIAVPVTRSPPSCEAMLAQKFSAATTGSFAPAADVLVGAPGAVVGAGFEPAAAVDVLSLELVPLMQATANITPIKRTIVVRTRRRISRDERITESASLCSTGSRAWARAAL